MGRIYRSTDKKLPSHVSKYFDSIKYEQEFNLKNPRSERTLTGDAMIIRSVPDIIKASKEKFDPNEPMILNIIANKAKKDRWDETVLPSAYGKRMDRFLANPVFLLQHWRDDAIGTCFDPVAKDDGLHAGVVLGDPTCGFPLTTKQQEARSLVAQKVLRALSIGFIPHVIEWDEDTEEIRHTDIELLEISLVSIPMQQDSLIQSIKSQSTAKYFLMPGTKSTEEVDMEKLEKLVEENTKALKSLQDQVGAETKKLTDENTALKAENEKLKSRAETAEKELADIKKESQELLTQLTEAGILKPEAAA